MYFYVRNNKGMIREKIEELRRTLDYHNHKYYVENSPEISDREFDVLMRELQELEAAHPEYADPNSPTARVGSDLTTEFQSVEHRFPMLSLGNTYSTSCTNSSDASRKSSDRRSSSASSNSTARPSRSPTNTELCSVP